MLTYSVAVFVFKWFILCINFGTIQQAVRLPHDAHSLQVVT